MVWGFMTAMNDILVPHFKLIFDLDYAHVMFIQFTFFAGYVVMAVPSGKIVNWIGYQRSMALGLATMGFGAFLFLPAAQITSWPLFLIALFVVASGMTLLQVSSNPYVVMLGPKETASSRLNLSQAFNSVGTAIAPWLGGALILSHTPISVKEMQHLPAVEQTARRMAEILTVRIPYLVFALVLFSLAFAAAKIRLPVVQAIESGEREVVIGGRVVKSVWRVRHLLLGVLGIFFYAGAEVSIGSFLISFVSQSDIAGLAPRLGAKLVSLYWAEMMVGRFAGSLLVRYIAPGRLLGIFGLAASTLVWITVGTSGHVAMWALCSVGLFNSIMFPNIFSLAIDGLGSLTSQGSALLLMATLGPAVIPVLLGALADRIGLHHAFVVPALCYLYVVFYGFRGSHQAPLSDVRWHEPVPY
jgi:FHS family L-fucose permease-like MFS transporter